MRVQEKMQRLLDDLVRNGRERGLQLAAYLDGKLVVDAWAGVADVNTGRRVDGATLFPVFSTTKGLAATLIHLLVERCKLTYDTPIAAVWPEFAAQGKQSITVRHALSHTTGLACMPLGVGYAELVDWDAMCRAIARMRPVSSRGAQSVYHAVTYSWLVGEVAHRVDGRPFGQMLQEEICRPLGIGDDMFVGIPDEVEPRVAWLEEIFESGQPPVVDNTVPRDVPGWMLPLHAWMNQPQVRRACVPASNGIMTARALARHYASLLPGGVDGVALLPPARVREATQVQLQTDSLAENTPRHIALGYMILGAGKGPDTPATAFGHGGYGGSVGFADPQHRLAVGLTKNRYCKNGAQDEILSELRGVLGIPR
jgi:CubicO group peptidase (beta-lactamase class C family)